MELNYALYFTEDNYSSLTLKAIKRLMSRIWKNSEESKIRHLNTCLRKLSEVYNIQRPEFRFIHDDAMYQSTGGGTYDPNSNIITLYKLSFVTFLHEFAHCIQNKLGICTYLSTEEFARGWSCSVYYLLDKERYQRAVSKGLLFYY